MVQPIQKWKHLKYFNFSLVTLCCAGDVMSLSTVITLTDDIQARLHVGHTVVTWALTAYSVTFAGFIAYFGRLGDIIGNATLLAYSTLGFAIFSLLCAVVPNFVAFAFFRAMQGVCGAAIIPAAYAIVPQLFSGPELDRFLSILATIFSACFGLGLILGGAFAETTRGYKGLFYLTFAFMFFLAVLVFITFVPMQSVRKEETTAAEKWQRIKSLDYIGIFLFVTGGILLVVGLTEAGDTWNQPTAYVILPLALLLLIAFLAWNISFKSTVEFMQKHANKAVYSYIKDTQVLMPRDLLDVHNFVATMACVFLLYTFFMGFFYIFEQYGELVDVETPLVSGVKLLPFIAAICVTNSVVAIKHDIVKPKTALLMGTFSALTGAIVFVQIKHVHTNVYARILVPAQIFIGSGCGLCYCHILSIVIGYAPEHLRGITSGVFQTFGQFGTEVTLSIMASILGNVTKYGTKDDIKHNKDRLINVGYYLLVVTLLDLLIIFLFVRDRVVQADEEKAKESEESSVARGENKEPEESSAADHRTA